MPRTPRTLGILARCLRRYGRSRHTAIFALGSIVVAGSAGCSSSAEATAEAEDNLTSGCTQGRRELSGTVGPQTWSTCSVVLTGPVRVEGDLSIRSGVVVEIAPGSGGIQDELIVTGRVTARGTQTRPIRLHARGERWSGVKVESSGSELAHVVFDRASDALRLRAGANRLAHVSVLRAQASGISIGRATSDDDARLDEQIVDYRFEGDAEISRWTSGLAALAFDGPGVASVTRAFLDDCPSSNCARVQPRTDQEAAASFGIVATHGARLLVEDSVLFGKDKDTVFDVHVRLGPRADAQYVGADIYGSGVWIANDSIATVKRSVIAGYGIGIRAQGGELFVEDATLARNDTGIQFETADGGATDQCRRPRPWVPPIRRDPHIARTDVRFNDRRAVYHRSSAILGIEESNIVDNGGGVLVDTNELAPGSALVRNNIHSNESFVPLTGGSGRITDWRAQVWARHSSANLELSSNYWGKSIGTESFSQPYVEGAWYVGGTSGDCREPGLFTVSSVESAAVAAGPRETSLGPAVRAARARVLTPR